MDGHPTYQQVLMEDPAPQTNKLVLHMVKIAKPYGDGEIERLLYNM